MLKKFFKNSFVNAISIMVGYIVGVGMFGLPYLTARSGIFIFLALFSVITFIQYLLHLIYADIVIETPGKHRLAGYAEIYLGKSGKLLAFSAKMIGNMGGLLAYFIITGIFAYQLFGDLFGGTPEIYSSVFFAAEAIIMLFGIGAICELELLLNIVLVITIFFISIKGTHFLSPINYSFSSWSGILILYGAVLFALDGVGSIPIAANLVKDNKNKVKKVMALATFFSAFIILLFTLVITGITGSATTPDALTGLKNVMGDGIISVALVLGLLTIITSVFGVAEAVKETLMYDYKTNKYVSWAITMFIPFGFFLLGFNNLTSVISFAGAVAGGISAIILIMIFRKMEKQNRKTTLFKNSPGRLLLGILSLMFLIGICYQIWSFFLV